MVYSSLELLYTPNFHLFKFLPKTQEPHFQWFNNQFSSVAQSCPTVWDPTECSTSGSLSFTNSWSLLKLVSIESVMPSSHLVLCQPLLLLNLSQHRVFSSESVLLIRWPKYWSFSISPFNEYSVLISFRIDWL